MCAPMTSEASSKPIFSLASPDGPAPSDSPDGLTTDLFGQALAPASLSVKPGPSVAARMSVTYGLRSSGSSASAVLQHYLASRLLDRMASLGSIMFALTWKTQITPLRRRICQLRASAHLTSDSDCGSWPTPMAGTPAQNGYNEAGNNDSSRKTVALA